MQQYLGVLLTTGNQPPPIKKLTKDQYQQWKKSCLFDRLQGLPPGQSFCNRFDIEDAILYYCGMSFSQTDEYIKKTYL
jgi:hypothetical protein